MNRAVELFTAVPKMHNCAQAVAAGAGEEELSAELKCCGGGKAPEGRCGALYAALRLTPEECHSEVLQRFKAAAGSEFCREIKAGNPPFSCAECVRTGAELVELFRK